jgi:hypothetical protein
VNKKSTTTDPTPCETHITMTPVASTAFPSQVATTIVVITALQPPRNDHGTRLCAALKEYHRNFEKGRSTVNSSNG